MSRCPGYVDVTVNDWTTSEELFHQCLVVSCPAQFNATFYLPHRALADTNNRTFLVVLNDTARQHHVFLTAVQLPLHREHHQEQLSEVDDDDNEVLERVLLSALSALFCCLVLLSVLLAAVTVRHHKLPRGRSRRSLPCERDGVVGCGRHGVVDVFVLLSVAYSFMFTFNGVMVPCRLLTRQSAINFVTGEDSVVDVLTTATSTLRRRLAELERLGGLSSLDGEDQKLQRLQSSVTSCSKYVDDLLTAAAFQIARRPPVNVTSRALERLRQVRRNFLSDMAAYVESEKTKLAAAVAGRALDDEKLRLDSLLASDWLRYARSLFHSASKLDARVSDRSTQFALFVTDDVELNAVDRWTSTMANR